MKKLLIALTVFLLLSCQKNEISLTGTLRVKFSNSENTPYYEIKPKLFLTDNSEIPLKTFTLNSKGETEKMELICGNYIFQYENRLSSSYYIKSKLIQIKPGENVYLVIDYKND